MANVTFRRGTEANLPSSGMADEGCFFLAEDTGNLYVGDENGNLVPINRSPYYGTCPTEASTNSKVVTIDVNSDVFSLSEGTMISVRFANANTAASPTLNVNGSGAIAVKSYGTTSIGDTEDSSWHAGEVVTFIYDGTYWMFVGGMGNIQPDWEQDTVTADDYIKNKPAIREGIGSKSIVEGSTATNESIGQWSHSEGVRTIAYSNASHAEGLGVQNTILLTSSTDEGSTDKDYQVFIGAAVPIVGNVIGYNGNYVTVTATNENRKITLSETLGTLYRSSVKVFTSSAKGMGSHIEGESTMTNNQAEHAEGAYNFSNTGDTDAEKTISSIGIGTSNTARKNAVEVMKNGNMYVFGVGDYDGTNTTSASTLQTVIGNSANVQSDWEEDDNTSPSYIQNKPSIKSGTGEYSIIEGDLDVNVASGDKSHAEGAGTDASGYESHSEGLSSVAYGNVSHAEGSETLSYGSTSHAEGSGDYYSIRLTSTAQEDGKEYTCGRTTTSVLDVGNVVYYNSLCAIITSRRIESNICYIVLSSTFGELTNAKARVYHSVAIGFGSHIEGERTMALNKGEHAEGTYNKSHSGSTLAEKTISSIGIGDDNGDRANALEVMKNGDVYVLGIGDYDGADISNSSTLQNVIDGMQSDIQTISETQSDWEEDNYTSSSYIQNRPSIRAGIGTDSVEEGDLSSNYAVGRCSHAEGVNRTARGDYSHAEGVGEPLATTISGSDGTYSSPDMNLFKIGDLIAYGDLSASIKSLGKDNFVVSPSLGKLSNANVDVYVDGAIGVNSHVEGWGTITLNKAEHAEGKFNVSHNTKLGFTISSTGVGTDNNNRINAIEVLSDGRVFIKGIGLYLGDSLFNVSSIQEVIGDIYSNIHSYTIASVSPDTGYLTAYQLQEDGVAKGAKINIPKDMVVSNGEVKTVTVADEPYVGAQVGDKYIDLTIANATTDHLYIPVKDLVDVYTEGNGIDISSGNVISVVVDPNSANGLSVGASGVALATATTSSAGAMSAADKTKLDGIASGAEVNVQSDWNQTDYTSDDFIKNKPSIPTSTSDLTNDSGFITSADVPTKTSDLTNDGSDGTSTYVDASDLATVATSGSYNDLDDKPTIPSISGLAQDSAVVHKTGNEQIEGIKTFLGTAAFDTSISINNNQNQRVYIDSEFDQINNEPTLNLWGDNDEKVRLGNIEEPRNDTDAATKYYVDHHGGGGNYGGNSYVFYGTCPSSATAVAKEVTCQEFTSSKLVNGVMVIVKFDNTNTGDVDNLTLNVGGTGAYPIKKIYANSGFEPLTNAAEIVANSAIPFIFTGSVWLVAGLDYNTNTNTIGYYLRTSNTVHKTSDGFRYYKLLFTSADGTHWVPASATKTNNASTLIAVNQRPINPFGEIVYFSATTNYSAEGAVSSSYVWQQYPFVLGYSFNRTGAALTLTTQTPVYIKCAPQSDGSAIIDADTPYVQALPSTEDGKIYIFLGIAYDATHVELTMNHPVYEFKNGCIRLYTNSVTYQNFVGSDDAHVGSSGLVPAPSMSSAPKILTSDRTTAWQTKDSLDIASKTYVDNMIGDIETLLAAI